MNLGRKLHCPICGILLINYVITYIDSISTGYEVTCQGCGKSVSIENRLTYELEGIEEFVCEEYGCRFWVENRDDFLCPNCTENIIEGD